MRVFRWIYGLFFGLLMLGTVMIMDHHLGGEKHSKVWWGVIIVMMFVISFIFSTLLQAACFYKGA